MLWLHEYVLSKETLSKISQRNLMNTLLTQKDLTDSKENDVRKCNPSIVLIILILLLTSTLCLSIDNAKAQSTSYKISGYVLDSNGNGIAAPMSFSMCPPLFQVYTLTQQATTRYLPLQEHTTLMSGRPSIQTTCPMTNRNWQSLQTLPKTSH